MTMENDEYEEDPINPSEIEIFQQIRFQLQEHIRKARATPWQ